jgi:hypothetical protein
MVSAWWLLLSLPVGFSLGWMTGTLHIVVLLVKAGQEPLLKKLGILKR